MHLITVASPADLITSTLVRAGVAFFLIAIAKIVTTTFPTTADCTLTRFYPLAIGLRHRLTGKQQPPTANKPTEELIWTCSICNTCIKGPNNKTLNYRRSNHMNLRRPGVPKRPEDRPFKPPLPIVHASNMIPHEQRAWTCAFCDHGLPYLTSKSQHQKSVRFHYQPLQNGKNQQRPSTCPQTMEQQHRKRSKHQRTRFGQMGTH